LPPFSNLKIKHTLYNIAKINTRTNSIN
jgi:hypothetical protein